MLIELEWLLNDVDWFVDLQHDISVDVFLLDVVYNSISFGIFLVCFTCCWTLIDLSWFVFYFYRWSSIFDARLQSGRLQLGGLNLGGYSLGGYCLGDYRMCHRFWGKRCTHLSRSNMEDPSTYLLVGEYIYICTRNFIMIMCIYI